MCVKLNTRKTLVNKKDLHTHTQKKDLHDNYISFMSSDGKVLKAFC